jgi:glycosyltransferase involved in cell wall biosynthesis
MASSVRIGNYARALASRGVDVKVVIAKRTEIFGQEIVNSETDGTFHNVPFHYVSAITRRSKYLLKRRGRDFLDAFATTRFLSSELREGDAVIGYLDEQIFLISRLLKWCKSHHVKYVAELCEYPYEAGGDLSFYRRMAQRYVFRHFYPRYDGVIAISSFLSEFARKVCKAGCKVAKVPILVDFNSFNIPDCSQEASVPYIFHCGTLYDKKDGFCDMLEAFGRAVSDGRLKARFVSTGSPENAQHPERLSAIIKAYGLEDRVSFTGYISREEISRLLAGAALVVINKPDNLQNKSNFSNKLGEYLAAGKPVIHARIGEAVNYLEDGKTACLVPCGDITALSEAMAYYLTHPDVARRMGEAGRELCRTAFDFRSNGEKLLEIIR